MGIPDSSLLDLLEKVRSWISWGASDLSPSPTSSSSSSSSYSCCCLPCQDRFQMPSNINNNASVKMCCECYAGTPAAINGCYHCQGCGRWLCANCIGKGDGGCDGDLCGERSVKSCKFCVGVRCGVRRDDGRKNSEKVHPSESLHDSPEPPSPSFSGETIQTDRLVQYLESRDFGFSPHAVTSGSMAAFGSHPPPVSVHCSPSRSDEEEAEDSGKHIYSPLSEYGHDMSDLDSSSVSARLEFYSCKSVGSSPLDSPSRIDFNSYRVGHSVQQGREGSPLSHNDCSFDQETMAVLERPHRVTEDPESTDDYSSDKSFLQKQYDKSQKPLDFENNGVIWLPPPPEDENDEVESNFFTFDDDEDDIGESGAMFSSSTSLSGTFPSKEKQNEGNKEPIRAVIQGHFRALVSQLLQGEGIMVDKEDSNNGWRDIVTSIAWQAANFVKPDTSRGGSMDPVDYVQVKCIASGSPSDSILIKGVVCTKNIKHKRMTTQYKNPRLLLLGGALEYQSFVNQLASFNTLVQQENDHLKMIVSKIESLRPNVLLVEKSVSPYAQEYLLAKEISLVLNVKKSLLERIARCTGGLISPSIDNIATTRLGHCELFRVEKVSEEHETANQFNKKPSKTLMFFEGCPRRLGCTVLLRGACREELKKIKHVVQYAVFAAYHLSLETSFLADEGASLPKMTLKRSISIQERLGTNCGSITDAFVQDDASVVLKSEHMRTEELAGSLDTSGVPRLSNVLLESGFENVVPEAGSDLGSNMGLDSSFSQSVNPKISTVPHINKLSSLDLQDVMDQEDRQLRESHEATKSERIEEDEASSEYFSATDASQSILVSFSSRCVLKGTVFERSRLLRIKFYGSFDKPLGRYLRDDLFDQTSYCRSCKERGEAHVLCYTHQQGNLTINVRSLSSIKLPGERDGKIWMWHRCLRCAHVDGVPPATRRVVMSDAAWGLSFGKFLELSFSNNATANRLAPCGHSLQRDCLRFYGYGSMVAFFRYSPIDIHNVYLPPSVLEFNGLIWQEWISREAAELLGKMEDFYAEISDTLDCMEQKNKSFGSELPETNEIQNHIMELKDQLREERDDHRGVLQRAVDYSQPGQTAVDILKLNCLRRSLLMGSHSWDRQLYALNSLLKADSVLPKDGKLDYVHEENVSGNSKPQDYARNDLQLENNDTDISSEQLVPENAGPPSSNCIIEEEVHSDGELSVNKTLTADSANLSERIDSAWTGTDQAPMKLQPLHASQAVGVQSGLAQEISVLDSPHFKRLMAPTRVHSFDSVLRVQERIRKGLPISSLHLSTLRSFHASGDYRNMVRNPVSSTMRTYSEMLPLEAQKLLSSASSFISSASHMAGGARLLLLQRGGHSNVVIGVYDDDPASIVSYALSSKEYEDWVADKSNENEGSWNMNERRREDSAVSAWQSFGSVDMDYIRYGGYGSEDLSISLGSLIADSKRSPHLTISYGDDSSIAGGKVKFSVTCYFAKQFDSLRKKCCPNEVDFVRSLSRCQRWSAQGGKSNVYFAKSLDDRFIIKQVTKTELESFEEFAPQYFKYLTDSLVSGSPTCLAKILGIYQVSVKHLKGGKEMKMDLMVMENLFFKRSIARVYDLKGSARSRYNPDTTGKNKVLLDMNLVETLRTEPIFLGSKAKRNLERAIWNDTSFLASVDVMDYSLLVGVDDERKELVLGIIDFMRQYTWDKHLETWVKASGILGGPKNASPTIVSPKQYKKRFRKAMTSYFLTVPDQWTP